MCRDIHEHFEQIFAQRLAVTQGLEGCQLEKRYDRISFTDAAY